MDIIELTIQFLSMILSKGYEVYDTYVNGKTLTLLLGAPRSIDENCIEEELRMFKVIHSIVFGVPVECLMFKYKYI